MRTFRIVKERHVSTAFTGEGASFAGGRWNSKGTWMVYCSGSLALAALETLVHLNPMIQLNYMAFSVEFDGAMMEKLPSGKLPRNWREQPPPHATQAIGDAWIREKRSVVLEVPSIIIPSEFNYLLNPIHPDFNKIVISKPFSFLFDQRLVK